MKILHTADIHLGAKFKGSSSSAYLRKQLSDTFIRIIDLITSKNIDLVLIAGDLFDSSQPSPQLKEFVCRQFKRIQAPVCLVPGTHEGELYRSLECLQKIPNLTMFLEPQWQYKEYPSLDTTVYGINAQEKYPLRNLIRKAGTKFHIAVLHGSFLIPDKIKDDILITADDIASSGMDYIALGHWHSAFECSQKNVAAWYPGAPEPIKIDEKNAGNVIIIDDMASKLYKIGSTRCLEKEIDITNITDLSIVKEEITAGVEHGLRCKIKLKGVTSLTFGIDIRDLERELSKGFAQLQIIDKTIVPAKDINPDTYSSQPLIKGFLELAEKEISNRSGEDKKIAEQALRYGLALLEGKDVL